MRRKIHIKGLVIVVLAAVVVWMAAGSVADDVMPTVRRGGVVVHTVGEQKSDMARMVEAYESLSSRYLSMVQQNLSMMSNTDQQILNKLDSLEKKIDELGKKINVIAEQTAPKTKPRPIGDNAKARD